MGEQRDGEISGSSGVADGGFERGRHRLEVRKAMAECDQRTAGSAGFAVGGGMPAKHAQADGFRSLACPDDQGLASGQKPARQQQRPDEPIAGGGRRYGEGHAQARWNLSGGHEVRREPHERRQEATDNPQCFHLAWYLTGSAGEGTGDLCQFIVDSELRKAYEAHHPTLPEFAAAAVKSFAERELVYTGCRGSNPLKCRPR